MGEQTMKKRIQVLMMAILACSLTAGVSFADPRGVTPAENPVCDALTGVPNGICVAFCEAQNCDENPDGPACDTLRNNWENITGNPTLPCEASASLCPCFSKAMILEQFNLVADPSTASCEKFETLISKRGTHGVVTQVSKVNHASSRAFNAQDWPEVYKDLQFCEIYEDGIKTGVLEVVDEAVMAACVDDLTAVASHLNMACSGP